MRRVLGGTVVLDVGVGPDADVPVVADGVFGESIEDLGALGLGGYPLLHEGHHFGLDFGGTAMEVWVETGLDGWMSESCYFQKGFERKEHTGIRVLVR